MQKLKNKDIDLLKVYKQKAEPSKYASIAKLAIGPVIFAIISVGIFGVFTFQNHNLQSEIDDMNKETKRIKEEIANNPNLERYQSLQTAINDVEKYTTLYTNIQSYPQLSQNTFDTILIASGIDVNVISFSYIRESQVITLQIEASSPEGPGEFVTRLKETQAFSKVDYSGYSKTEKTVTTPSIPETQTSNTAKETTTESNTDSNPDTSKNSNSTTTAEEALLQALLKNATSSNTNNNTKENTQTTIVYTATILCTLK